MNTRKVVHFSQVVSLKKLVSTGEGACGERGQISGYSGMITCPHCRRVLAQYEAQVREIFKQIVRAA